MKGTIRRIFVLKEKLFDIFSIRVISYGLTLNEEFCWNEST